MAGLRPAAVVVVATVRALKLHGGLKKEELKTEDLAALEKGLPNLLRHVSTSQMSTACPAWWPSTASRTIPRRN